MAKSKDPLGDPIQELKSIVGESNVLDTKDEISKHLTDFSYLLERMPLCIVFPKNLDETQQVFKIAYKFYPIFIPFLNRITIFVKLNI